MSGSYLNDFLEDPLTNVALEGTTRHQLDPHPQ